MIRILKSITAAAVFMLCLSGCGSADARNEKAKQKKAVTELSAEEFNAKVYDMTQEGLVYLGDKPAIVDFTASWCGPCQRIAPVLEELAAEYAGRIAIYKIDIDKEKDLAKAFNVSSIPAILYIPARDGEPVMTIGSRDKGKFVKEIDTFLLNE